jgi:Mg2+/Co2+ transporter CorC
VILAVVIALLGVAGATMLAAAEGALLSPEGEPPSLCSGRAGLPPVRERSYRALALSRLLVHLATGAAGAIVIRAAGFSDLPLAAVGAALALLAAVLCERLGRRIGSPARGRRPEWPRALGDFVGSAFAPVAAIDMRLDRALASVFPPVRVEKAESDATDQFRHIVASEATVTRRDAELITGVFSLGDTAVRDVMVPRVDVVGVERSLPWADVVDRVRTSEHARLPVFDETPDELLGILFAKDLLPSVIAGQPPEAGWLSLLRPPTFIPETKLVDQQLREFQAAGTQMAVVVDEYGGMAGIVTIEDILEEIVGEIQDEYDQEEAAIEPRDGRGYWVSGRVSLTELAEVMGHEFAHAEANTVGGLIFERLGRVPKAGQELTLDGFRIIVERVVRRRVERIYIERGSEVGARGPQ